MTEQWQELKETIIELRDNNGICTQQEVCKFLVIYMDVLEKQMQESSGEVISRQAVNDLVDELARAISDERCCISRGRSTATIMRDIRHLPSINPQPKMGRWIYDKTYENWRCSECGEIPKTMGYCGSANFMMEHFRYCNHCGIKMQEVEE